MTYNIKMQSMPQAESQPLDCNTVIISHFIFTGVAV